MLGHLSQGGFPIQLLPVLSIPAGKTAGGREGGEELLREGLEMSYRAGRGEKPNGK